MNYFQKYLAEEFAEDYQDGRISRRDAHKLITSVTGSLLSADAILAACSPAPTQSTPIATPGPVTGSTQPPVASAVPAASTPQVSPDDATIEAGAVQFPGQDNASLLGYQARPKGAGPFALVFVCHENRGLTPYIQDVVRRVAKAGYTGLAVDLLSRHGGTPALSPDQVPGLLGNTPPAQFVQDFQSGLKWLQGQPYAAAQHVGMVGFCFGGGVTWQVAIHTPELKAAVPFYGPLPPVEDVPSIQAPVEAFYGGLDQRINSGIAPVEAAMQQNHKVFEKVIYPGADHAFHNDTGTRYNPQAAHDAWKRTLEWFGKYLAS